MKKTIYPDFIIPGFSKCGTRSLWYNLNDHPQIEMAKIGDQIEMGYFNLSLLDSFKKKKFYGNLYSDPTSLKGEKTPSYILYRKSMKKIASNIPDVKLIISVRDPIQRFISLYHHKIKRSVHKRTNRLLTKNERLNNSSLLKEWDISVKSNAEEVFISKNKNNEIVQRILKLRERSIEEVYFEMKKDYGKIDFYDWIETGRYFKYIKNNVLPFFKKSQICFVVQERLLNHSDEELNRIFGFLGVKPHHVQAPYKDIHTEKPSLPEDVFGELTQYYQEDVAQLRDWSGQNIDEWADFSK